MQFVWCWNRRSFVLDFSGRPRWQNDTSCSFAPDFSSSELVHLSGACRIFTPWSFLVGPLISCFLPVFGLPHYLVLVFACVAEPLTSGIVGTLCDSREVSFLPWPPVTWLEERSKMVTAFENTVLLFERLHWAAGKIFKKKKKRWKKRKSERHKLLS